MDFSMFWQAIIETPHSYNQCSNNIFKFAKFLFNVFACYTIYNLNTIKSHDTAYYDTKHKDQFNIVIKKVEMSLEAQSHYENEKYCANIAMLICRFSFDSFVQVFPFGCNKSWAIANTFCIKIST